MPLNLTLLNVNWDVIDTALPPVEPGAEPQPCKLLRFRDPDSGILVDIPLPIDPLPETPDEPGIAEKVALQLTDNKPRVEIARTMPPVPPNGQSSRPRR